MCQKLLFLSEWDRERNKLGNRLSWGKVYILVFWTVLFFMLRLIDWQNKQVERNIWLNISFPHHKQEEKKGTYIYLLWRIVDICSWYSCIIHYIDGQVFSSPLCLLVRGCCCPFSGVLVFNFEVKKDWLEEYDPENFLLLNK